MYEPDVIEVSDGDEAEWVRVSTKDVVRIDETTWELASPDVNERRRYRVNGRLCAWHSKSGDGRVLLRAP